jgi:hypothetical protein
MLPQTSGSKENPSKKPAYSRLHAKSFLKKRIPIVYRKDCRISSKDAVQFEKDAFEVVNSYKCLRVQLQRRTCLGTHLNELVVLSLIHENNLLLRKQS